MRSAAPDTDVDPPGLPLSVALIDDHAAPRHGLSLLLHAEGFDIVGEAGDVGAGIALLRDERPDLALVDLGDRSVALLSCARSRKLTARVLVFAAEGDASMLDDAMAAGPPGSCSSARPGRISSARCAVSHRAASSSTRTWPGRTARRGPG